MDLLAFDTGTDTLSIGVSRDTPGQARTWSYSGAGGARASTELIPRAMELLQQAGLRPAELDAICFGSGPGSFTGLRTACAVAQGLAFGANVPVLPVDSLLAVAEEARFQAHSKVQAGRVVVLMDARMNELYTAEYAFEGSNWSVLQGSALVRPEDFVPGRSEGDLPTLFAGNAIAVYGERLRLPHGAQSMVALPTATAMLRLAPQLLAAGKSVPAAQALPTYIRDKVAKTTVERADEIALNRAGAGQ